MSCCPTGCRSTPGRPAWQHKRPCWLLASSQHRGRPPRCGRRNPRTSRSDSPSAPALRTRWSSWASWANSPSSTRWAHSTPPLHRSCHRKCEPGTSLRCRPGSRQQSTPCCSILQRCSFRLGMKQGQVVSPRSPCCSPCPRRHRIWAFPHISCAGCRASSVCTCSRPASLRCRNPSTRPSASRTQLQAHSSCRSSPQAMVRTSSQDWSARRSIPSARSL
mmetsp:Transcript_29601/g.70393  ORF Transcript_29601/g.70393 Transcript_29601/m.70393 type:complete len:219 (+) Transcript_29601:1260-1916(+)